MFCKRKKELKAITSTERK